MEKISAAFSMDWSIDLEKGLRSKLPGQEVVAIENFGCRLHQWSMEPARTKPILDIYGLVPGEDRTFANAILLRLTDAFRTGDNNIRLSILKIFMIECKYMQHKGMYYDGMLAKHRVPNHMELLKRIKEVFDRNDVTTKVLAIRLFGCLSCISKDSTHIQHIILQGLQSSNISVVKASLFAAGCFCVFSDDFAALLLELLTSMLSSGQIHPNLKKQGVRYLAKMRCSPLVAIRAYKSGKKLLNDEYMVDMLISLTKLASKFSLLISEQVDLLLSLMGHDTPQVRCTVFKCLYTLLHCQPSPITVTKDAFSSLLCILEDHCESSNMFSKILCSISLGLPYNHIPEFLKLIRGLENMARFSIKTKKCLALGVLVDIFCNLNNAVRGHWWYCSEKWQTSYEGCSTIISASSDAYPTLLVGHVISLITDHLSSLIVNINLEFNGKLSSPVDTRLSEELSHIKRETRSLLNSLLRLAEEFPALIQISLEKMQNLVALLLGIYGRKISSSFLCEGICQMDVDTHESCVVTSLSQYESHARQKFFSELIGIICRFVILCLDKLDELGLFHPDVLKAVELIMTCIQQSDFGIYNIYAVFCLHMQLSTLRYCCNFKNSNFQDQDESEISDSKLVHNFCWFNQEFQLLEFVKRMLMKGNYSVAYRAGKYSCCEGAWFAAAFTFKKLMGCAMSVSHCFWFKALMLLSGAECELRLLIFPKAGVELVNGFRMDSDCGKDVNEPKKREGLLIWSTREIIHLLEEHGDLHDCEGKIARAYSTICSSIESLVAAGVGNGFQIWFLSIRAKVFNVLLDLLGLLNSLNLSFGLSEANLDLRYQGNTDIEFMSLLRKLHVHAGDLSIISIQLKKLAKEYDLLLASFFDIDFRSSKYLSRVALSCSLLAFCTEFALSLIDSPSCSKLMSQCTSKLSSCSYMEALEDLVVRLWGMDHEVDAKLKRFVLLSGESLGHLEIINRWCKNRYGYKDRACLVLCEFSLSSFLCLKEEEIGARDARQFYSLLLQRLLLIGVIARKWMETPFELPKFFFRVRPCIGAELFVFNAKSGRQDDMSVFRGEGLSLSLCLQMKNATRVRAIEMYCILYARQSDCDVRCSDGDGEKREERHIPFLLHHNQKTAELVELNSLLLQFIKNNEHSSGTAGRRSDDDVYTMAFARFEPDVNGQGFSSCLLDISDFPAGSYKMKWCSCIINKHGSWWSPLPLNAGPVFSIK